MLHWRWTNTPKSKRNVNPPRTNQQQWCSWIQLESRVSTNPRESRKLHFGQNSWLLEDRRYCSSMIYSVSFRIVDEMLLKFPLRAKRGRSLVIVTAINAHLSWWTVTPVTQSQYSTGPWYIDMVGITDIASAPDLGSEAFKNATFATKNNLFPFQDQLPACVGYIPITFTRYKSICF